MNGRRIIGHGVEQVEQVNPIVGQSPGRARAGAHGRWIAAPASQRCFNVATCDASVSEVASKDVFVEVALYLESALRFDHRFVKRQVLKCVQRVVVNKDAYRSLSGQQVSDVVENVVEVWRLSLMAASARVGQCVAWLGGIAIRRGWCRR
jgi:hypothetical protein